MTKLTYFIGLKITYFFKMNFVLAILTSIAVTFSLFISPVLGAFFGGVGGWLVGILFGDLILGTLSVLGIKGLTMWQIGVTLGFLSGYFKSASSSSS